MKTKAIVAEDCGQKNPNITVPMTVIESPLLPEQTKKIVVFCSSSSQHAESDKGRGKSYQRQQKKNNIMSLGVLAMVSDDNAI
jgi:hypothetical protein